ncbi:MAG: DUF523 domain-containing protein [Deltaproteobacteria bacterium]|nr:DUF523 domain-containing protein [Deltaproteobacteria bacterium]
MPKQVPILISACLLGERVRYDGRHKLDPFLLEKLKKIARWVPVCPEVGCGLSVPREPMNLKGDPATPRLAGVKTGTDYTERMSEWLKVRLLEMEPLGLCGYVCKKNSPSCSGMGRIDVFDDAGNATGAGTGIFTKAFMERFPRVPVEEEGRLRDPQAMEAFLYKVVALRRDRGAGG